MAEGERPRGAEIDRVDDEAAIEPLQDIISLLADSQDLHRLALCHQPVGMLARQPRDRGIEAAAQAAFGGAHDKQMRLVLAVAGEERRRVIAAFHRGREIGQHDRHALRIGTRGNGRFLSAAQFRCRHHLHRLGDLARRFHRRDAISEVF